MSQEKMVGIPPVNSDKNGTCTKNERIAWIDVAKGLGMILVIWGHLLYSEEWPGGTWLNIKRAIYSFHMPMYFMLSGYVSHQRRETLRLYAKKKFYQFITPAIICIVLTLPLYFLKAYLGKFPADKIVEELFFLRGKIAYNDPVWFLLVIYQVLILYDLMRFACSSVWKKTTAAVVFFGIGYIIYEQSLPLPFGLEKTMVCMGFYLLGNTVRDLPKIEQLCTRGNVFPIGMLAVWYISGVLLNVKVSLYDFQLGQYWLFVLSGISGSLLWFRVAYVCRHVKIFAVWGCNTILVLGTHYVFVSIIRKMAGWIRIKGMAIYDPFALVVAVCMMIAYMPVCSFVERYFPAIVGKQKRSLRIE